MSNADTLGDFTRKMIKHAVAKHRYEGEGGAKAFARRIQMSRRAVQGWWLDGATPRGPSRVKLWSILAVHHPAHFDLIHKEARGELRRELDATLDCVKAGDYADVTTPEERRRLGAPEAPRHIPGVVRESL